MPAFAQDNPAGQSPDHATDDRQPSDRSGPYIAISGGLVLSERLRTNAGVSARLDDGFMGLVAVGGRVGPFRAEVEGSYRRASVGDASGFGLTATGIGNVSALSAMGNLYLEPSLGLGSIRPYFGGGVGVSRFRAHDVSAAGLPTLGTQTSIGTVSGSKTGFAYQGMAGLSGPVSGHLIASFGYRYFATPGVDVTVPLAGRVNVRGLRTHGIEAGLRLPF
ncbi:MAG: outer membrane protein [Janthinobacterium lividum]